MSDQISIRPFRPEDAAAVRDLFIRVNRALAPRAMRDAFEAYIERSLAEEIDRIADYYAETEGGFWVALDGDVPVGMFGLEVAGDGAMELRRMYVEPARRRQGIARAMLTFAEQECIRRGRRTIVLSTSELQGEALAFYRRSGYVLLREEAAVEASNKTLGGGIHRYYFAKAL